MSSAERSDSDVDAQLAAGFCRELKRRSDEIAGALSTWQAARDARDAARDAVEPAKKRAWAAQLRHAADAGELTRRLEVARDVADRARRELAAAKERVRDAVENAESDVLRIRAVVLRGDAAARVERMAYVTIEHARAARDEAGLGPSPEDAARRSAGAFGRTAGAGERAIPRGGGTAAPTEGTGRKRRGPKEPRIVIVGGAEIVVGVDSMLLVLRAEHVGCRSQVLIDALSKKGEIQGAAPFGDGKNPPWAAPRRALVAWGRARRQLPVAP